MHIEFSHQVLIQNIVAPQDTKKLYRVIHYMVDFLTDAFLTKE